MGAQVAAVRFVNIAAALVLLAHGFAHTVGFVGPWRLSAKVPYNSTVLNGRIDLGSIGARVMGVLWLLLALDFALLAWGAIARTDWWQTGALVTAVASLVLCLVDWPDTRIGALVNVVIIAVLLIVRAR